MVGSCGRSATSSSSLLIRHQGHHLRNLLQGHAARVHRLPPPAPQHSPSRAPTMSPRSPASSPGQLASPQSPPPRQWSPPSPPPPRQRSKSNRQRSNHQLKSLRRRRTRRRRKLRSMLSYHGRKLMRNAVRKLRKRLTSTSNRRSQRRRCPLI
jgi:hypothetical protein